LDTVCSRSIFPLNTGSVHSGTIVHASPIPSISSKVAEPIIRQAF
jgi:hypothetical protein